LRERREDIPVLVTFFLELYSRKFSRFFSSVAPEALKKMAAYSWPGNIRELKNSIERICIMQSGPTLLPEHLPPEICGNLSVRTPQTPHPCTFETGLEEAVNSFEKELISAALDKCNRNVLQAAQLLKIPRGTLRYKMEKMGI
jgi:DNA-binding NtrC family response regulator